MKKVIANMAQPTEIRRECTDADNFDDQKGYDKFQSNGEEKMDEGDDNMEELPKGNAENPGDPDNEPDSSSSEDEHGWNQDRRRCGAEKDGNSSRQKEKDEYNKVKRKANFIDQVKNKKDKFTGEFEDAWIYYETGYRLTANDLQMNRETQLRLLQNLLHANTFEEAIHLIRDIYVTPAVQAKVTNMNPMLNESLQHHIEERKATDNKAARKLYHTADAQKSLTPDKYGNITEQRRPKRSHGKSNYRKKRSNDCHTFGKKWSKGHVCRKEDVITLVKNKIAQRKTSVSLLQMIAHAATAEDQESISDASSESESSEKDISDSSTVLVITENIFEALFKNKMKQILKSQKDRSAVLVRSINSCK